MARNHQLQHPGALQERCSGQEAAVAASRSVAGAWQCPGVLQERCSGQEAAGDYGILFSLSLSLSLLPHHTQSQNG